jgi:hypothetical protein
MGWLVAVTLLAGADSRDDLAREVRDKGWIVYSAKTDQGD